LGNPRAEASWIVSASSGKPSGYDPSDYHPTLFTRPEVIRKGQDLQKLIGGEIREKPLRKNGLSPLPPLSTVAHHSSSGSGYQVAGIDLAWISEKNGSGIAIGVISENQITLQELHCGIIGLDDVKNILKSCSHLQGVAVDAPLIIENPDGARPCEHALSRVYGSRWAGCYPSSKSRYPDASSVKFSNWLEQRRLAHLGSGNNTGWQIECYPHPAILELFELSRRLKYKKGSLEEKRAGQIKLARYIMTLESSPQLSLAIPDTFDTFLDSHHISSLSGIGLKNNEDALDALICLYIAGLYAAGIEMTVFGDIETGYIVVPNKFSNSGPQS
jgi:predicted RNase H-like nuclease